MHNNPFLGVWVILVTPENSSLLLLVYDAEKQNKFTIVVARLILTDSIPFIFLVYNPFFIWWSQLEPGSSKLILWWELSANS